MTTTPHVAPADPSQQLQFLRHNFDNHQNLIRLADAKAAAYVTLIVFLAASAFAIAKDVVGKLRWHWGGGAFTSCVYVISYAGLLLAFLRIVKLTHDVIKPRGARHYTAPQAVHSLMFYEHVLLHDSNESYFNAIAVASLDLLIRNTSDQVFELAHICSEKMAAVTRARRPLLIAFISWVLNMCAGLFIVRWA